MGKWARIQSARDKIGLADDRIRELQILTEQQRSGPWDASTKRRAKGLVDEALGHLRPVLDYLATDIRAAYCKAGKKGYFPIYSTKNAFDEKMPRAFRNLEIRSPEMYSFLESVQPYHTGYGWLLEFNTLINDSKHDDTFQETRKDKIIASTATQELTIQGPFGPLMVVGQGVGMQIRDIKWVDAHTGIETSLGPDIDTNPFSGAGRLLKNELSFSTTKQSLCASLMKYRHGVWFIAQRIRFLAQDGTAGEGEPENGGHESDLRHRADEAFAESLRACQRGDIPRAVQHCREAVALYPLEPAFANLGCLVGRGGDLDGAIRVWQDAIDVNPRTMVSLYYNLGVAFIKKGDLDNAIAALREAIRHESNVSAAHFNLGVALEGKGNADEAIVAFSRAIECSPGDGDAHYRLACLYAFKSDVERAVGSLSTAIRIDALVQLTFRPDRLTKRLTVSSGRLPKFL